MSEARPARILNVNDDEATRYAITRVLRKAGFESLEAATGAEALRLAESNPDLVILDINLPDVNGLEVCRRIKSSTATSSIVVLHISATYVRSQDRVLGLEGGADGYLTHPVEPPELIATVRSLLRLRQAEETVREAGVQWQATFEAISDGVCLTDAAGVVIRCNRAAAALLGRPGEEIIGSRLDDLTRDLLEPVGTAPADSQGRISGEARRGDHWLRVTVDPVYDAEGVFSGSVRTFSDISERKNLEAQLRQRASELAAADQRKNEFLAMLAHELRNPLGAISNALSVLNRIGTENEHVLRQFGAVGRQLRHLTRLVDDLLDVSRITHGKIELRLRRMDLEPVVRQAVSTCRPRLEARNHQLFVSLPEGPLWLDADPTRVEQIVANLLDNAIKYTEPGGEVHLTIATESGPDDPPSGTVVIRVRDTGIGIGPEMLPQVFDLFAQADQSLERARGGLGIGLTLVRSLVEMHGGRISVTSAGADRGSEFVVRLPLVAPNAALPGGPAIVEPVSAPPRLGAKRVVIIEDNSDACDTLRDLLELQGHQVVTAGDGERGVRLVTSFVPHFALVDIGLPGLDGYEVARLLRSTDEGRAVRLIALTGYGQPQDRQAALDAGFDAHLVKPVDPESLLTLLSQA